MDDKYIWERPSCFETQNIQGETSGSVERIDYEKKQYRTNQFMALSKVPDEFSQSINYKKGFEKWKKIIKVLLAIDGVALAILGMDWLVELTFFCVRCGFRPTIKTFLFLFAISLSGIFLFVGQFRISSMFATKKYSTAMLESQTIVKTTLISIAKILVIALGILIISFLLSSIYTKILLAIYFE